MDLDRVPPQDLDAEQATLGSMLLEPGAAERAFIITEPGDFYHEAHQIVCEAMLTLHRRGELSDLVTVRAELRRCGFLEKVGGGEYLTALMGEVPTAAHVTRYASIVAEKALLRRMIAAGADIQGFGFDNPEDVGAALHQAEERVLEIAKERLGGGPQPIQSSFEATVNSLEHLLSLPGVISAQRSGIRRLDHLTFGLASHRFVVVKADSGVGKSTLARQILVETARRFSEEDNNRVCLYFGLEEDRLLVEGKLVAYLGGLDSELLTVPGRWGHLKQQDPEKFAEAESRKDRGYSEYAALPILTDYEHPDLDYMEAHVRRVHRAQPVGLVVIDYFQRIHAGLIERGGTEEQIYRNCAERLATLGNWLEGPVICPSQVTYNKDLKRWTEKGARAIKDNASLVLRLQREEDKETEEMLAQGFLSCEKRRGGSTFGKVMVHCDMARGRIWDRNEWEELQAYERSAGGVSSHDNT